MNNRKRKFMYNILTWQTKKRCPIAPNTLLSRQSKAVSRISKPKQEKCQFSRQEPFTRR